jgi:hypothetical protein
MKVMLAVACIATLAGLSISNRVLANCGRSHKSYPENGILCLNGSEFVCGSLGAWHKTLKHCDAKPDSQQTPPAPAESSKDDGVKDKDTAVKDKSPTAGNRAKSSTLIEAATPV